MSRRQADMTQTDITLMHMDITPYVDSLRRDSVLAPKLDTGFRREPSLNVTVTVPNGSDLSVRTGSAPIAASGTFGDTRLKGGSGDIEVNSVEGAAVIETGAGDITIGRIREEAKVRSGSGHV